MNTENSAMQKNEIASIGAQMSAHDCAQGFLHGGQRLHSVTDAIRAQYEVNYIDTVARELIRQSGATTSGDKAIANFGTLVRRAVPKDEEGNPLRDPLTVKFKLRKSRLSATKALEAQVMLAKPARKPDSLEKAAKALADAAAHLCDSELRGAAVALLPAMRDCGDAMPECKARDTLAQIVLELERIAQNEAGSESEERDAA